MPLYFDKYDLIYSLALLTDTPISFDRENAPIPYTIPKLTAFALLLSYGVTHWTGWSNTCDAVTVWISIPCVNAFLIVSSPDI